MSVYEVHSVDACVHGADVSVHGADVSVHGADVMFCVISDSSRVHSGRTI